jgi:hypothetical protein
MVIRRFGVLSVAKIAGAVYALIGLIAGGIMALVALMGGFAGMAAEDPNSALASTFVGVGSVVIFPIIYGCLGFIGGALSSALYNLIAGFIGGIQLEIESAIPAVSPASYQPPVPRETPRDPGFPG